MWSTRSRRRRIALRLLIAALSFATGLYLRVAPLDGAFTLTVVLSMWFLAVGLARIVIGIADYDVPGAGMLVLNGVLSLVLGDDVTLVSSAEETAKDVYRVLTNADLLRDEDAPEPEHAFLATGDPEPFARLGRRFLGPEVGAVLRAAPVGAAGSAP